MRIAYITAGAGGMYCGSCLHDNTLAAALHQLGHDCLLIPTYTPTRTDEENVSEPRVFFGGISIYLAQKSRWFRGMPRIVDRLLSRPGLLRWVTRTFGMKTRPEDLAELTISMLKGEHGPQRQILHDLLDWLEREAKPDVVCFSNALLSGVIPELKHRLGVPVVVTLQGDDIYIDWLPAPQRPEVKSLIAQNCRNVEAFIATCRFYADFMAQYLALPRERMQVVYPGIRLSSFGTTESTHDSAAPLTIGYLARVCPEKGLHVLVEACDQLVELNAPPFRLRVAGHLTERDQPFLMQLQAQWEALGKQYPFEYIGEVDHAGKLAFLRTLDILSVPTTYPEPKGLYVLEACAAGVPVVQPRHGSFPELIEMTGGGLLVKPDDPADLALGLQRSLLDADLRKSMGDRGRAAVQQFFTAERMARETARVFDEVVGAANAKPRAASPESP
jgi:glycosyltransferase involved in cell wall biosynthesis